MLKEKEQKKQENKEYLMQQQQTLKSMSFICSFFFWSSEYFKANYVRFCLYLNIFVYEREFFTKKRK